MGDSLLQGTETQACNPTSHVERFAAFQGPGARVLWKDCQSLSSLLTGPELVSSPETQYAGIPL